MREQFADFLHSSQIDRGQRSVTVRRLVAEWTGLMNKNRCEIRPLRKCCDGELEGAYLDALGLD